MFENMQQKYSAYLGAICKNLEFELLHFCQSGLTWKPVLGKGLDIYVLSFEPFWVFYDYHHTIGSLGPGEIPLCQ